jgi:hypothetical protein
MDYKGIRITGKSGSGIFYTVKISAGVHNIFSTADAQHIDDPDAPGGNVLFTSITVDTTNNVVSGYNAAGDRYIVDKQADLSASLGFDGE